MGALKQRALEIAELNDRFRRTFNGGRAMLTDGVNALPEVVKAKVIEGVKTFAAFNKDSDPQHEHDFGSFEIAGRKILWKIDTYDRAMQAGSEDPSDPAKTTRVLTIMLAEEY